MHKCHLKSCADEKTTIIDDALKALDSKFNGVVSEMVDGGDFKAKKVCPTLVPEMVALSTACPLLCCCSCDYHSLCTQEC